MNTDNLIQAILDIKKRKLRNILIMFDEMSQALSGRGYTDKVQTTVASFLWQMPKRDIILLYTSNPGNSVDVIIRDATWYTIMPVYHKNEIRSREYITYGVIDNYGIELSKNNVFVNPQWFQTLFDTDQPID